MLGSFRALVALVTFIGLTTTASAAASVAVLDLAAEAGPIENGGSTTLPFTVNFIGDGFGCPSGGSVTLPVEVTGMVPDGATVTVEPAEVTIGIPAGLYMALVDGAPVSPFNGSADASLTIAATNLSQNATVPFTVVATFPGGLPEGCQGNALPEASGEAGTSPVFVAPPAEPIVEQVEEEPKSFLPAPGLLPSLVAVAAALAVARRSRA